MDFTQLIKKFKRAAARYGLFSTAWLITRLPWPVVGFITHIFMAVGFRLTVRLKRIARESLETAFGREMSEKQIRQIIRNCFENLGKGMMELIYYSYHPKQVKDKFIFEGKEHLYEALKHGRGVIAVTGHFGNFPLMQMAFAQYGFKTNVIVRRARDEAIADYAFERMNYSGVRPVYTKPRKKCVDDSIRALKDNEMLWVLLDQNFGSDGGVYVDFFGQKAATATGPVVFAERTKSPVLMIFNVREKDGRYRILIEPFELEPRDDHDEMVLVNIARMTKKIEEYVRRYPHEWGWMHRRWKSQQA